MPSYKDFEMLNSALNTVGHDALTRRQMTQQHDAEMTRLAMEQQYRQRSEDRMDENAKTEKARYDLAERVAAIAESRQKAKDAQEHVQKSAQSFAEAMQELSLDTTKTPEQKTQYFRSAIDTDPEFKQAMLQHPDINAFYNGTGDWKAAAEKIRSERTGKGNHVLAPQSKLVDPTGKVIAQNDNQPGGGEFETTTQKFPAVEAKPADVTTHWFSPATTNAPAVPYQPERTVTTRQRINPSAPAASPAASAPAYNPSAIKYPEPPVSNSIAPAPAQPQMVRVKHPNGQTGMIPAANLQSALQQGYTQIQ